MTRTLWIVLAAVLSRLPAASAGHPVLLANPTPHAWILVEGGREVALRAEILDGGGR